MKDILRACVALGMILGLVGYFSFPVLLLTNALSHAGLWFWCWFLSLCFFNVYAGVRAAGEGKA